MKTPLSILCLALSFTLSLVLSATLMNSSHAEVKCNECHTMLERKVVHPAASDSCENCHENPSWEAPLHGKLSETGNGLCLQCHDEAALGNCKTEAGITSCAHPVAGHPISGMKDPLYPKKDFGCTSCHNPHSSDMPKMFRYNYDAKSPYKGEKCAVCHWSKTFPGPAPTTPPWGTK